MSGGALDISAAARRRARIRAELPTAHPDALDDIDVLLDGLPDPVLLSADETAGTLRAAQALVNRLHAYQHAVAAAADRARASRTLGAGTTGMLVAAATGTTPAAGSAMVAAGLMLDQLPGTREGFHRGAVRAEHAQAITRAAARTPQLGVHETPLATIAAHVDPGELRRLLQVLQDAHDPARPDLTAAQQAAARHLDASIRPNGMVRITGLLPEVDGRILLDTLAVFTDPPTADDPRTPAQRRADALSDLAAAGAAHTGPPGASTVSILVDAADTLDHAALADGTPLTEADFDYHSCTAVIQILFGTTTGHHFVPLRLARTRRRATHAQWAALIARDRGCIRCGRAPRHCHAHHILHWQHGGLTNLDNLALLCTRCHADLHHGHYHVHMTPHGTPAITHTRAPPTATPA